MKKTKWLVPILAVLVLIAVAIYAYLNYGVSADAIFNQSNDLTCISKVIPNKVLFNLGDNNYIGNKSVSLNTTEKASPEGIFLRKENSIYFTNGLRYAALPKDLGPNYVTIKVGDIYYAADVKTATDISKLKISPTQTLWAYKGSVYILDTSERKGSSGYLYQWNGITRLCNSAYSYEYDVARSAYQILSDVAIKYNYYITVVDAATNTALTPSPSTVNKKTYQVSLNQTVNLKENWEPSIPGGSAHLEYISGKDNIEQLATTSYKMVKYGTTTLKITYTLPNGSEVSDEVTFEAAKG